MNLDTGTLITFQFKVVFFYIIKLHVHKYGIFLIVCLFDVQLQSVDIFILSYSYAIVLTKMWSCFLELDKICFILS